MVESSLELLSSTCPKLEPLAVDVTYREEPLIVHHENLQELTRYKLSPPEVRIACPQLTTLCSNRESYDGMVMPNLDMNCPYLKHLRVTGYNPIGLLPFALKLCPLSEMLHIGLSSLAGEDLDLVHPHIRKVGLNGITRRQK